jgi:hypothetical protein
MRKLLFTVIILIFLSVNLAQASNDVGLLPSNPFYFLKEWRRDLRGFFTINPIKRAELELQIIREKSAEIKKLRLIDALRLKLEEYTADLMERALRQVEFYFESGQRISITETMAILPFGSRQWESFATKLLPLLKKEEITGVLWVKELEKIVPEAGRKGIGQLKEDLLLRLLGKIAADNKILESLPRESLAVVELLDDLKEYAEERADLRNPLNQIRQGILNWAKENKKISRQEADQAITLAEGAVNVLETVLAESPNSKSVVLLKEKAKFNLTQARASLESFNFSDAFGQASLASAATAKAFNRIFKTAGDLESDVKNLKLQYDQLAKAGANPLLAKAEKLLVKSADALAEESPNLESINSYILEVKILLAQAGL